MTPAASLSQSLRDTIRLNYGSSPDQMERSLIACVDAWVKRHLPIADQPELLAEAADLIRRADGRPPWNSADLPGHDIGRARAALSAVDAWLARLRE